MKIFHKFSAVTKRQGNSLETVLLNGFKKKNKTKLNLSYSNLKNVRYYSSNSDNLNDNKNNNEITKINDDKEKIKKKREQKLKKLLNREKKEKEKHFMYLITSQMKKNYKKKFDEGTNPLSENRTVDFKQFVYNFIVNIPLGVETKEQNYSQITKKEIIEELNPQILIEEALLQLALHFFPDDKQNLIDKTYLELKAYKKNNNIETKDLLAMLSNQMTIKNKAEKLFNSTGTIYSFKPGKGILTINIKISTAYPETKKWLIAFFAIIFLKLKKILHNEKKMKYFNTVLTRGNYPINGGLTFPILTKNIFKDIIDKGFSKNPYFILNNPKIFYNNTKLNINNLAFESTFIEINVTTDNKSLVGYLNHSEFFEKIRKLNEI